MITATGFFDYVRARTRGDGRMRDARVFAEQVKSLYQQLPVGMAGTTIGAIALVLVMWGHAPSAWLTAWLAVVFLNQLWRLGVLIRFRRAEPSLAEIPRWCGLWLAGAAGSGILFGIAGYVFFDPDSLAREVTLIFILFVMCGGAVPLLATYQPSLYAFVLPALLPVAARLALDGDANRLIIATVILISLFFMLFLGHHFGRLLIESLHIRFENVDLVEKLSAQNRTLETARNNAEIANRSKTQFFAAASHDLRQPLHAMGLFAAALVEKVRDPEVINVVHSIAASVEALEALFNELLDISKIDAGVIKPNPTVFAMQGLFDRLRMDLEPEAAEKELTLRFVPTERYTESDPLLVERILRNLVTNAIRYTRAGGIVVGVRRRGERLAVEVWDSGPGIPNDQQERVFEEFYQVGNPERDRRKGLGLGLSIVKRLSNLLEADIALASRPAQGTVFRFMLPISARPAPAVSNPAARSPAGADLAGVTVLVIDDEPTILEAMQVLLSGWGATVVGAASLEEARGALGTAPQLVIADYRLREEQNGIAAIEALRRHFGQTLPAILVTGSSSPELAEIAKKHDAHLIAKPVMPAKLRTLINFKLKATRT